MLVALGLAAIPVLYYQTTKRVVTVQVAQLRPHMNISTISIEGMIISAPFEHRSGDRYLLVDDGSGVIGVLIPVKVAGRDPCQLGTYVRVVGDLMVQAETQTYRLLAHTVELIDQPNIEEEGHLSGLCLGQTISLTGRVESVRVPKMQSNRPYEFFITNPSGVRLPMIVWRSEQQAVLGGRDPEPGDVLALTAKIGFYKGMMQLEADSDHPVHWLDDVSN